MYCYVNEIECDFYLLLVSPLYSKLRKLYIKPYYWEKPSVYKLINLLNVHSIKQLRNLGNESDKWALFDVCNLHSTTYVCTIYFVLHTTDRL